MFMTWEPEEELSSFPLNPLDAKGRVTPVAALHRTNPPVCCPGEPNLDDKQLEIKRV